MVKTGSPNPAHVGDLITYTYVVTNTGDVTLTGVTVTDNNISGTIVLNETTLAPGEWAVGTLTYTVSENDLPGPIENIATATGIPPTGGSVTDDDDESIPILTGPAIEVVKTGSPVEATCGEPITYNYSVTNTGGCDLINIEVNDDKLGPITNIIEKLNGNDDNILNPGETWIFQKIWIFDASNITILLPPGYVTMTVFDGTISYFDVTLSDVPSGYDVTNGNYLGWCVQLGLEMPTGQPHLIKMYSTYDDSMPIYCYNTNWPKVNYILNNKQGNEEDVQHAIWYFINGMNTNRPFALSMIADAEANGGSFYPTPGQKIAIICAGCPSIQRIIIEILVPNIEITNIATVSSFDVSGYPVSDTDSTTIYITG